MAQRALPTTLKKQGKRNAIYRDTDGKTYACIITVRTSATVATLVVRVGGMKRTLAGINQATAPHQSNVWYFPTGH